ncbi:MAG: hypothetical protein JJT96_05960 [Opitutales bacterium]|nr:hypothetical protein [Opitutales bacterium]
MNPEGAYASCAGQRLHAGSVSLLSRKGRTHPACSKGFHAGSVSPLSRKGRTHPARGNAFTLEA